MPHVTRREQPGDEAAIHEVNVAAFGQPDEADLVDRLRRIADPYLSFVATQASGVIGHALFTPVTVRGEAPFGAMALGPLAVRPPDQRRGVGAALTRAGLEACATGGHAIVFVLGDPAYYGRFGFTAAAPLGLHFRSGCETAFQVLQLRPGALAGRGGTVVYLPPFDGV